MRVKPIECVILVIVALMAGMTLAAHFDTTMSHISIHTGFAGDQTTIDIEWYDHDNVRHTTQIMVNIQAQDKPRTLEIEIEGKRVYEESPFGTKTYLP